MNQPPVGTVTFLFTDIQGSTRLWQRYPAAMSQALSRHHEVLSESIGAHGGYVFQIIGDAFCAAFSTANDGLQAALDAQRSLAAEKWGETEPVCVRMALHTGSAELQAGGYTSGEYVSGLTLSRAARLLSAGHGGQILLSLASAELVRDHLPKETALRDLGTHRLKDLIRPEHIYQVVVPDLPAEFLPLKTLDTHPNNLPVQLTSFIGREHEMARIKEILGSARLLTLTGAGGTGKTRMALQLAADLIDEFPDGVWFIELASLADPALIPQTVVSVLRLHEESRQPLIAILSDYLRLKTALLVLDNCEHLIEACARFADTLLRAAPNLKLLAASREAFGIGGETAYRVPSLAFPPLQPGPIIPQSLAQYEAVRLFIDRALAVQPDFTVTNTNAPAVAQISHRLDGIPLAIELAAARVKVLSVEQIATRLDDAFRVLTGGSRTALPRHQTLRASIDWSHGLLVTAERVLFRRLAVFAGGWTLDAAEGICAGDGIATSDVLDLLQNLVGKSLVAVDDQTDYQLPRYHLLEVVRQYASEKLGESGEGIALRDRHLNWFLQLAEESNSKLLSAAQVSWLNRLDAEHDNFRAALTWAIETNSEQGLHLTARLSRFWVWRGYWLEAQEWFARMLALPAASSPTAARAGLLLKAFDLPVYQVDLAQSKLMLEESLDIWRQLEDKTGLAQALYELGDLALSRSDFDVAAQYYTESLTLYQDQGDRHGTCRTLLGLGDVAAEKGDWSKATGLFQESLGIFRALGKRDDGDENPAHFLGFFVEGQGNFARAQEFFEEGLALDRQLGSTHHISWALRYLGALLCRQGDFAGASVLYEESLALARSMKDIHCMAHSLVGLARVAQQMGDDQRAEVLVEEALPLYEQIDAKNRIPEAHGILGSALIKSDPERAMDLLKSSLTHEQGFGFRRRIAQNLQALASAYLLGGMDERAVRFYALADALREAISFPMTPWELAAREKELSTARTRLGEAQFNAAWEAGRKLTIEQAIELTEE